MASPARQAAFEILLRVETQGSFAADLLHSAITGSLGERDAALCTELVLGTLRRQRALDFVAQHFSQGRWSRFDPPVRVALRLGLYQLHHLIGVPARAAVHETVELVKAARKRSAAGLVNAILRQADGVELGALRPAEMGEMEWAGIQESHPQWLLERWCRRFGMEEGVALARANNQPAVTYLRSNLPGRGAEQTRDLLAREGIRTTRGNLLKTALMLESGNLARSPLVQKHEVVVQDEASQMVAHLLDVQPGNRVLDLCAAPGHKSGIAAQFAGPTGMVAACDVHLHRLRQFTMPVGMHNVHRVAADGERPLPLKGGFDRVLVDAPCSGTGTLRRNPELKWRLLPGDITELAEKQAHLLENASVMLGEEGRLVYSTCSLEPEENQEIVERFLREHPDFRLLTLREDAGRMRRYLHPAAERLLDAEFFETRPSRDSTDGFFAAILVRRPVLH